MSSSRRRTGLIPMLTLLLSVVLAGTLEAQWTHRYPKVQGYSHHVYLEGYELPILTSGPMDPAVSPDGTLVAFAARGWLWLLDLSSGEARRLTNSAGIDARPAWSPDGRNLAFVRDDGKGTRIVRIEIETAEERLLVDEPAIDLDPAFSADGRVLFYSSAVAGDLDLWSLDLGTGTKLRLTSETGLERDPQPTPDGASLLYLSKTRRGQDALRLLSLADGTSTTLEQGRILSQSQVAVAPDGRTIAYGWPVEEGWQLRLLNVDAPGTTVRLESGDRPPLAPSWSPDSRSIWYAQATTTESTTLVRIPASGGEAEAVPILSWDWTEPPARLIVRTRIAGESSPAPARLSVLDGAGHPAVPDEGPARFDGQNGRVFFYSPGVIEVTVPAGQGRVSAVQGLLTPEASAAVQLAPGETREVDLVLEPVWNARQAGWAAGDHHFHLNYGGPYWMEPNDLLADLRGEALDVATPLLANLHNRFGEQDYWGWERSAQPPLIAFGQEIRSHFLGHLNLLGIRDLYWPWVWGPGYEVYGREDRTNGSPLAHARSQGGLGGYVHPVARREPFAVDAGLTVPAELVPDAVLGDVDLLEVACLWSDELGTSEVWHRLLNLGLPVAASAGTDVMSNLYRTMAVGTTRVYVLTGETLNLPDYLDALARGRSFVTTGPVLLFTIGGAEPGDVALPETGAVITTEGRETEWTLDLRSAIPVDSVEILLNGEVVWRDSGLTEPGARTYSGTLLLPRGGWVAARAYGGETRWPAMDSYPFAHTGPIWIDEVGSTDPVAASRSALELLGLLDLAQERMREGYGTTPTPNLDERLNRAREVLTGYVDQAPND